MMMLRAIAISSVALAAACAVPAKTPPAASAAAADIAAPGDVALALPPERTVVLAPISQASLPSGECGMILWTLDEARPAPVFRYVSGKKANISVAGAPVELTRIDADGAGSYGVFERQVFSAPDGLTVTVEARFSLGFDGGSYLERGLLTVERADGWRAVAPTAGIAGCRS